MKLNPKLLCHGAAASRLGASPIIKEFALRRRSCFPVNSCTICLRLVGLRCGPAGRVNSAQETFSDLYGFGALVKPCPLRLQSAHCALVKAAMRGALFEELGLTANSAVIYLPRDPSLQSHAQRCVADSSTMYGMQLWRFELLSVVGNTFRGPLASFCLAAFALPDCHRGFPWAALALLFNQRVGPHSKPLQKALTLFTDCKFAGE